MTITKETQSSPMNWGVAKCMTCVPERGATLTYIEPHHDPMNPYMESILDKVAGYHDTNNPDHDIHITVYQHEDGNK